MVNKYSLDEKLKERENAIILNQYENVNDENEISLDNGIVKTIGDTEYIFPENE